MMYVYFLDRMFPQADNPQCNHVFGMSGKQTYVSQSNLRFLIYSFNCNYFSAVISFTRQAPSKIGNMIFVGPQWDAEKAASGRESLIEAFYDFTGRRDIKFGKLITLSRYT